MVDSSDDSENICKGLSSEIWNDLFEMVENEASLNGELLVALWVEKTMPKQFGKWLKLLILLFCCLVFFSLLAWWSENGSPYLKG